MTATFNSIMALPWQMQVMVLLAVLTIPLAFVGEARWINDRLYTAAGGIVFLGLLVAMNVWLFLVGDVQTRLAHVKIEDLTAELNVIFGCVLLCFVAGLLGKFIRRRRWENRMREQKATYDALKRTR